MFQRPIFSVLKQRIEEPRRFIHSRLLTTVTERYWAALNALARVRAQIDETTRVHREEELSKRWDET